MWLPVVCLAMTSLTTAAQTTYIDYVWGYAKSSDPNIYGDYVNQDIRGMHITDTWKDRKPTKTGAYSWTKLDSALYQGARRGLYLGVQVQTGIDAPDWVKAEVGTFNTTGGSLSGPWPYYFNPLYKQYLYQYEKDIILHLALLPQWVKDKLIYVEHSNGSKGDEQPYKGTPTNYSYGGQTSISDADWNVFTKQFWDTCNRYHQAYYPALKSLFNSGNDGNNYDYNAWTYPGSKTKEGFATHIYTFSGQKTYFNRNVAFYNRNVVSYTSLLSRKIVSFDERILPSRGELQGVSLTPTHSHKENFFRFVFMKTAGVATPDIPSGYVNQAHESFESVTSPIPVAWFNTYSGFGEISRGYSLPRDAPDFADSGRFAPNIYGAVIASGDLPSYNAQIAAINALSDSISHKDWLKIQVLGNKINPARITAILAAVPGAQNNTASEWTSDCGVDMVQNMEMNLTQMNVLSTSVGVWRVGSDTSFYGRWARRPILISNKQTWPYDVSDKIMQTRGLDTVNISVTYLDSGFNSFKVVCYRCREEALTTVTKTNTGNWKTVSVDAIKFRFKPNIYDFWVEFTGSTTIGMVEVWDKSKR